MSQDTKQAMERAIEAHLADERDGAILTGYVLSAKGRSIDNLDSNTTRYMQSFHEGAEFDAVFGLLRFAQVSLEEDLLAQTRDSR